ncbi:MAG: RNA 2',3'-cyclic phosphodiesterase [Chlorobiaceae bacterium]|nr:RNA 2',3'-cyclic phosphodiesterase [Chlorobiaceae bacterium]NTV60292.1 RNA 2',3'-cyclic phosphodiesterase [Chlorobiaceae bacterium]
MGKTRVFVGIPAEEHLIEEVLEFRKRHAGLRVRWIEPENLHITVIPPWESENPSAVYGVLCTTASGNAASEAVFTSVKPGPVQSKPRLVWATGDAPPFFGRLRDELHTGLQVAAEDYRPYLLHLTIARVRQNERYDLIRMKFDEPVAWAAVFRKLCLFESLLKPSGAEYRVLFEVPFGMKNTGEP